jgi:molecular chaperone GrpE (heat shock protein)
MDTNATTNFKRELAALATIRDELKLKAHLAKKDLQDELDDLETKWLRVDEELQRVKAHAKQDVQTLSQSARELVLDLKQGYESIKRRLA